MKTLTEDQSSNGDDWIVPENLHMGSFPGFGILSREVAICMDLLATHPEKTGWLDEMRVICPRFEKVLSQWRVDGCPDPLSWPLPEAIPLVKAFKEMCQFSKPTTDETYIL